jgi:hypothetical protein
VVREELVLAAVAVRPLREVPLRPDLLQSFAWVRPTCCWSSPESSCQGKVPDVPAGGGP